MSQSCPKLHIAGIGGTAMTAVAVLAKQQGWQVSGSDQALYPPMSEVLADAGINVRDYHAANLQPAPDLTLIGNALSRGNPEVEAVLRHGLPYSSGAAFIGEHILPGRHAMVVAGTHGKTSTSSILAYILHCAGIELGMMIGGIPENFACGARLGNSHAPFVLEGDEYDTALFDKRSKFLHYHARTLILNNLEYDHADIFSDLEAIKVQFAHLLRTVPDDGLIIVNADDENLADVLQRGCWSPCVFFAHRHSGQQAIWQWQADRADGRSFTLWYNDEVFLQTTWLMLGEHQVSNACAAAAAAHALGVDQANIAYALKHFLGVRRRMTLFDTIAGVRIFDDFAHHPTAIRGVVRAAAANVRDDRQLWVIIDPRSNTMRSRQHQHMLTRCFDEADHVFFLQPAARGQATNELLDVEMLCRTLGNKAQVIADAEDLSNLFGNVQAHDDLLVLSNGSLEALHTALRKGLKATANYSARKSSPI